ncbi:hypothetical protein JCM3775_006553 [Rhodotorula graminis]
MADPRPYAQRLDDHGPESSRTAQNRIPDRGDDPHGLGALEQRIDALIANFRDIDIDVIDERSAKTRRASRQVLGDVIEDSMLGHGIEPPTSSSRDRERSADPRDKRRAGRGSSGSEADGRKLSPQEVVKRNIRKFQERLADPHLDDKTRTELVETLRVHEEALAERKEKEEFLLEYGEKWKKQCERMTWSQQGWDTPTPEIGRLWLRRHRILDDPWTGTYHWRDYGMGRRVPATPAAKAEVAAINEKLEPLLKAWQEEKDKTKYQMRKIEDLWHYMQDAIDYDFTIYKTMEKQYAEALVEPIDCSPPPPPPGPGHRRRFIEYVKRALPRRSTAEEPATNAHSLGVGEGFYRMRRRYFNERY